MPYMSKICAQTILFFRFATVKYDHTGKNLWNPCMHLCNYSINKYHSGWPSKITKNSMNLSHPDFPEDYDYAVWEEL